MLKHKCCFRSFNKRQAADPQAPVRVVADGERISLPQKRTREKSSGFGCDKEVLSGANGGVEIPQKNHPRYNQFFS